jgi:DNA-binding IclR family transcriptional regulator
MASISAALEPRPRRRDRPSRRVTDEQQRAIQVLACLERLHGRPPELAEMAEVFGTSKPAVLHRLHWLEKKGLWRRDERTVTELGLRAALGLAQPR